MNNDPPCTTERLRIKINDSLEDKNNLQKRVIFLESENKKLKLMFEQNMANLNQRIKMLQEKEKKARKDKNDMMEMLDEINFNDESKRKKEIIEIQGKFDSEMANMRERHSQEKRTMEKVIKNLKLELHRLVVQKKQEMGELGSELLRYQELCGNLKEEAEELREKVQVLDDKGKNAKAMRGEQVEIIRELQKEHNEHITRIVSDYERKLGSMKSKILNGRRDLESQRRKLRVSQENHSDIIKAKYVRQVNELNAKIEELEAQVKFLKAQLKEKKVTINSLNLKNYELMEESNKVKKEMCIMKAETDTWEDPEHPGFDVKSNSKLFSHLNLVDWTIENDNGTLVRKSREILWNNGIKRQFNDSISYTHTPFKLKNPRGKGARYEMTQSCINDVTKSHVFKSKENIDGHTTRSNFSQMNKSARKSGKSTATRMLNKSPTPTLIKDKLTILESRVSNIERESISYTNERRKISKELQAIKYNLVTSETASIFDKENSVKIEDDAKTVEDQVNSLLNRIEKKQKALKRNYKTIDFPQQTHTPNREKSVYKRKGINDKGFLNFYKENKTNSSFISAIDDTNNDCAVLPFSGLDG